MKSNSYCLMAGECVERLRCAKIPFIEVFASGKILAGCVPLSE